MVPATTVRTRFVPAKDDEPRVRPDGAAFEALLTSGAPAGPRGDVCLDARDLDLDEGLVTFRAKNRA